MVFPTATMRHRRPPNMYLMLFLSIKEVPRSLDAQLGATEPQASSAELHSAVSQICNLRMPGKYLGTAPSERPPIENRRYSRFRNLRYEFCSHPAENLEHSNAERTHAGARRCVVHTG